MKELEIKNEIIFIVNDITPIGGVERATLDLASAFIEKNYPVTIFSIFKKNTNIYFNYDEEIKILYGYDLFIKSKLLRWLSILIQIKKNFKKSTQKIITTSPNITIACALLGIRNIYAIEHSSFMSQSYLSRILRINLYKKIKKIITLTEVNRKKIQIHCGVNPVVIPNFYKKEITFAKKKLKNNNEIPTIITVGRLSEEKGMDDFICLCKNILDKGMDCKFEIFGEGPLRENLAELIKKNGLDNYISIKENELQIENIFNNKALYINMSRFESFGLVILESMAMGVPVAAYSDLDGPCEIIKDHHNGVFIDRNNLEASSLKIIKLVNDSELCERLISNGYKTLDTYKEEAVISKWLEII